MNADTFVLILSFLGTGVVGGAPPSACTAEAWSEVILAHVSRYPGMEVADLYKLLHQGSMGSEHAVPGVDAVRAWMDDELATMGSGPGEALVDTIAPGGAHLRIHLRPFVERGGDPDVLLSAFVGTANGDSGSLDALNCAVETSLTLARDGQLPWSEEDLTRYVDPWRAEGYPSVHHSDAFTELFRPAYRVVSGSLLAQVLESVR